MAEFGAPERVALPARIPRQAERGPIAPGREGPAAGVLALQRQAGNRAVSGLIVPAPVAVARVITPAAAVGDQVVEPGGTQFVVEKVFGGPGSATNSQIRMYHVRPVAGGQERVIHADDPRYSRAPAAQPLPQAAPAQQLAAVEAPFNADPDGDFTFEGWFMYFFEEIGAASRNVWANWAQQYKQGQHQDDGARRAALEAMFREGFIEYDVPSEQVAALGTSWDRAAAILGVAGPKHPAAGLSTATEVAPGDPPPLGSRYEVNLPILAGTSLGYRCDSRDWDRIQEQGGSKAQARVEAAPIRQGRNFDKPWNPFSLPARQQKMFLRKVHQDNCLRTVVSVAMDLRDTVTFPKPKVTMSGADSVTIYVVYVPKAMDTSALALDLWRAARWERGETAAFEVPAEHHLMRLEVERLYDPNNTSYVVGRILRREELNKDRWPSLPGPARQGLTRVGAAIDSGELRWFEWGRFDAGGGGRSALVRGLYLASRADSPAEWQAQFQRIREAGWNDLRRLQDLKTQIDQGAAAFAAAVTALTAPAAAVPAPAVPPVLVGAPGGPPPPPRHGGPAGPPPPAPGPAAAAGAANRHRGTVKNHLQEVTRLSGIAVQEAAVAGLSARLYPIFQQLFNLNKAARADVDAAATRTQIARLNQEAVVLMNMLTVRMSQWDTERDDLAGAGKLSNSGQWEEFLKRVMASRVP